MAHEVHTGPYASCEPTYFALFAWIKENGQTICGPIREIYPNDPRAVSGGDHHGYLRAGPVAPLVFKGLAESTGQFTR
jgi:hypothetical protein